MVIDRLERRLRTVRRRWSRSRWMGALHDPTGRRASPSDQPGLLVVQIDGLSTARLRRALDDGTMPFLARLARDGDLVLHPVYSGVPAITPAVQAELFYGVESAVPGFSFLDRASGELFRMYQRDAAAAVEARVAAASTGSLLAGGGSFANIYTGGAVDARFCMAALRVGDFFPRHRRGLLPLVALVHVPTLARLVGLAWWELARAPGDLVAGLRSGEPAGAEVKFLQSRVAVGVVLRELQVVAMSVALARGRPVVYGNFLGYDENAHRRGPDSALARQALRATDRVVARLWRAAHRSSARAYDVWVISDHGQEPTDSYRQICGEPVADAIARVAAACGVTGRGVPTTTTPTSGEADQRARLLGERLIARIVPGLDMERVRPAAGSLTVTAQGSLGHVYVPLPLTAETLERFAAALVADARVPLVLHRGDAPGTAVAHTAGGRFVLPAEAEAVLGDGHPYAWAAAADLCRVVAHPDAGELVISGWQRGPRSVSFPFEHGAHAGPGPAETDAFALVPPDTPLVTAAPVTRPGHLRAAGFAVLRGERGRAAPREHAGLRLLTYNVHGCVGLDDRLSPERIARVIARRDPDVVALQELDVGRARSGGVDQARAIADALQMDLAFHPTIAVAEEAFGDAVLSRHPLRVVRAAPLPGLGRPGLEPRGALWVHIDVPDDAGGTRPVQVVNTHLSLHPAERMMAARALVSGDWLGHPDAAHDTVLCGDFNALAWFPTMRLLTRRLRDVQAGLDGHRPRRTWAGRFPLGRIDHVLVDPRWRVVRVEVPDDALARVASDHRPVVVDVVLR